MVVSVCVSPKYQKEVENNVEFGEAVLTMLKRKAECQLEILAPAHDEHLVEFWRSLLDVQTVQAKLGRERHRLSIVGPGTRRVENCYESAFGELWRGRGCRERAISYYRQRFCWWRESNPRHCLRADRSAGLFMFALHTCPPSLLKIPAD